MRNRRLDKEGNGNFLPFHLFFHFPKANDLILNLSAENGQVTGYKERDGLRCIELEQQPEAGSPQLTYTILFDPERNFLPIQIQLLNRVESPPELFAEYQIHYHDFNGELLPEHWVYLHPEENDDGEAEMRTGKTRMENYVLNKEYSESDFTYTPQPGELIMTDQSEQDDDETEQITFAKLQSDGSLEEIELDHLFGEEGMSPFEYEKTIEKIAGLVLILILAFAVWRQKSR